MKGNFEMYCLSVNKVQGRFNMIFVKKNELKVQELLKESEISS